MSQQNWKSEDIELLNRLDEEFLNADLKADVENMSSIHELNDLDDDEHDSFFSSDSDNEAHPTNDQLQTTTSYNANEKFQPDGSFEKDMDFDQDVDYDLVKRLTYKLHEKEYQYLAMELKANHLQLQLDALSSDREQQEIERDEMDLELLRVKQNNSLLEVMHYLFVVNPRFVNSDRFFPVHRQG